MEIIGHRGASYDAPENTLASVELAWQQGADAVEIDVRLTADGHIAAVHDADLRRTAGVDWQINQRPLKQMKTLDVGRFKDEAFAGEKIPTLDEILQTVPDEHRLLIEVKCGPELLPALREIWRRSGRPATQIAVISFEFAVVLAAKRLMPKVPAYWVLGQTPLAAQSDAAEAVPLPSRIEQAKAAGLDGLDLDRRSPFSADYVAAIHEAGLGAYTWTVDDPVEAAQLRDWSLEGLTTNRPGWLRAELAALGSLTTPLDSEGSD